MLVAALLSSFAVGEIGDKEGPSNVLADANSKKADCLFTNYTTAINP
jgi:hypothetical protein